MKYRVPVLETFCWQEPVLARHSDPGNLPQALQKGHRYLVQSGIGTWAGKDDNVAWYDGSIWRFDPPDDGWQLYDLSTKEQLVYITGIGWTNNQSSDKIILGTPSDGSYLDGLSDFVPSTKVADAIDEVNEVLKEIAPPDAEPLTGKNLTHNASTKTAKIPAGLPTKYYVSESGNKSPGDVISNLIVANSFIISSPSPSTAFNKGDQGKLLVKQAINNLVYNTVATLDIAANFDEALRPTTQNLSNWDNQGTGDPCTDGRVTLNNNRGQLQVTYCGRYNLNKWQRMNCQINVSNLDTGFNGWKLVHELPTSQESNVLQLYYDYDTSPLSFSVSPDLVFDSYGANQKYLSGVRYYTTGDKFTLSYTGSNVYKNHYHSTAVSTYTWGAITGTQTKNPGDTGVSGSNPPNYDDNISYSQLITINAASYRSEDSRVSVSLQHPYKSTVTAQTPSYKFLVNTYGNTSGDLIDNFVDENYRLPLGEYTTIPGSITGQWDSSLPLTTNDALVYAGSLRYCNIDFSTYSPVGPNYSGRTGDQKYIRAFRKTGTATNSISLILTGLTNTDVGQIGSGDINVEVKLPGLTGWLDAGKPFDSGSFTGATGQGCRTSQTGSTWGITFGSFSTANSGYIVIIRITFRTANKTITGLQVTGW